MKIVIWLGCILVFSLAQLILSTQGIMLGGIPTALLAAVLVFIPAPALCKKWQERHGQTGETKSAETPPVPPDAPPAASNPGRRQKVHAYVRTAAPPSPTADAPRTPEDSTPSPSAETPQHTKKPRQGGKIPIAAAKLPVLLACGCLILAAAFCAVTVAIRFLGSIPLIGPLLYYPSDAAWALVVLPPSAACFAAVGLACKISRSPRPMAAVIILFWLANIAAIFLLHNFTWRELLQSIAGIICAGIFLFQDQENVLQ